MIDLIIQQLRSQGLLVVRASDGQMVDPEEFAKDIAAQWAMCEPEVDEPRTCACNECCYQQIAGWRPSDGVRQ